MKPWIFFALIIVLAFAVTPSIASEDDAVAAVFVFGRSGGRTASGFAVGDGSYIVTSSDVVKETLFGKSVDVPNIIVVSRWTGDAYSATIQQVDEKNKLALLKMSRPAVPGVAIVSDDAFKRTPKANMGQLLSGEECGGKFPTRIYALDLNATSKKYAVKRWDAANACLTEISDVKNKVASKTWLFLSETDPPEKAPKSALVAKLGVGALGVFNGRLIVTGGAKPVTFYRVLPAWDIREFLRKAGLVESTISSPPSLSDKVADAENTFQTVAKAVASSIAGTSTTAADNAQAALSLRPNNPLLHMLLGSALVGQGKFDDAIKSMNKAIELDPSLPNARLTRGMAYAAAGKTTEAEQDLRKAMQEQPKDSRPVLALCALLGTSDKTVEDASKLMKSAAKQWPDDLDVRILNARLMKRTKDYDGAITELRAVLQAAPEWGLARVALGSTYEAAGKPDDAEIQYRKLVETAPNNVDAHLTLIEFLISVDKKDEARKEIDAVKKLGLQPDADAVVKKLEQSLDEAPKKK